MAYLFGDSDTAAERLEILAEVYADSSEAFLRDVGVTKPPLAIDLGCGTGHTTYLLGAVSQADRVVGLDNSQHFISLAARKEAGK